MESLPSLVQLQLGHYLDWSSLQSLSLVNTMCRRTFWLNSELWQHKYRSEIGSEPSDGILNSNEDWLRAYFYQTRFSVSFETTNKKFPKPPYSQSWLNRHRLIVLDGMIEHWLGVDDQGKAYRFFYHHKQGHIEPVPFEQPIIDVAMIFTDVDDWIELFLDLEGRVWLFVEFFSKIRPTRMGVYQIEFGPGIQIKAMASGHDYGIFLDQHGQVWMNGSNPYLCYSAQSYQNNPRMVLGLPPIIQLAAGENHILFLDHNNQVWGYGLQLSRQLSPLESDNYIYYSDGRKELNMVRKPTLLTLKDDQHQPLKVKKISAGHEHSLILDFEGRIWGMGLNDCGQLNKDPKEYLGDYPFDTISHEFGLLSTLSGYTEIEAGPNFSLWTEPSGIIKWVGYHRGVPFSNRSYKNQRILIGRDFNLHRQRIE